MSELVKGGDLLLQERLRWRCRRGLLELDLILARFIEQYSQLDNAQRDEFDRLLDMPDTLLWDAICGRIAPLNPLQQALLERINKA